MSSPHPFLGNRSDVIGYRRVLLICLLGATLTTLPQAFTDNYWVLTAPRFAVGFFIGGILPTANALIGRLVPRAERGTVYGFTASEMFLRNSMGPLTGGCGRRSLRTALGVSGHRRSAAGEPGLGLLPGTGICRSRMVNVVNRRAIRRRAGRSLGRDDGLAPRRGHRPRPRLCRNGRQSAPDSGCADRTESRRL